MLYGHGRLPGSAAPRSRYAPRVVAPRDTVSTVGLEFSSPQHGEHHNFNRASSDQSVTFSTRDELSAYDDYVHVRTGVRAMIPVDINPSTGARIPFRPVPPDFYPVQLNAIENTSPPSQHILQRLLSVFGCANPPAESSIDARPDPSSACERIDSIRQPDFESVLQHPSAHDLQPPTAAQMQVLVKTLSNAKVKLELATIGDWSADFKSEVGRADAQALLLLESPDWRSLLDESDIAWPIEANTRIATYISANLDKSADRVVIFLNRIRTAEATGRQGIAYSGMDQFEEIRAMVEQRSIGTIKLDSKEMKDVQFEAGATQTKTILRGAEIRRNFDLKPPGERAIENALIHEIIAKIPDTGDAHLTLKKQDYEDDLHKAEMKGAPPPWTVNELIAEISVDLARVHKQLSAIEKTTKSAVKCANCTGDHHPRDCDKKCSSCQNSFCPGNPFRLELCAALADIQPSKRTINDVFGKPLPAFLVERLDKAWLSKHPGKELSMLEAGICTVDTDEEIDD